MELRPETPDDHDEVDEVVGRAFAGRDNEQALVRRLREDPGRPVRVALVAADAGRIVGHVMLTPVDVVDGDQVARVLVLAPLSVHPEAQGRGVGGALVRRALELAATSPEPAVVVLGDPDYYGRFGFEPSVARGILPPAGVPAEAFGAWVADAAAPVRGTVRFPAVFEETGTL